MQNTNCSSQGCLVKWLVAAAVTFAVLFGCGYVIHHIWLMPIYQQTVALWLLMDQMQQMFPLLMLYYVALALIISALFCKIKKAKMAACATDGSMSECRIGGRHCPIKFGICFGLLIGLFMGVQCAGSYIWMPIPKELAVKWLIGDVVQGLIIGVVLSLLCGMKKA